ncbi:MAG: bifunctional 5,10-methylenetetrahydrofolate dehydrogenase/5,10-methenyltetrahydrofolate cyclohydrolase [Peptostreptococcaceae bacterium]
MKAFDCKIVRDTKLEEAKQYISTLSTKPRLLIIQVGDRPDSNKYINNKINRCEDVGIKVRLLKLSENTSEECLINHIKSMQNMYHGLIVQCPLPAHINEKNVMAVINPLKDVDGLTPTNIGLLHNGTPQIVPATAQGVMDLLDFYKINVEGLNILLVGRSLLVNRPLQELLCQRNGTVTLAHSKTINLEEMLSSNRYDIVISAIGRAKFLENIKCKYIIDVGINFDEENKMCGDVNMHNSKCEYHTTVPMGVGILTVASVISNVLRCHILQGLE